MSRILIISKWLPYPLSDGGKQAIFNSVKVLSTVHEVHLTYFEPHNVEYSEQSISDFKNLCNNLCVHRYKEQLNIVESTKNIIHRLWRRLLIKLKCQDELEDLIHEETSLHLFPNEYLEYVNLLIEDLKIEIVQVEMLANISIVLGLPKDVKKIFVHHELGFIRNKLIFSCKKLNQVQQNKVKLHKILEISLLNCYDAIVTLSEIDKEKLMVEGVSCPIYTSFAIVTNKSAACNSNKNIQLLSFVGPESHKPNKDGLTWFLNTCWEELLLCFPSMKLQIIGRWSPNIQKEFLEKYNNIIFRGFVEDLTVALQDSIMIVPILVGSGIRMKILESSQIGVPFITTSVGVEGLPFQDAKDCFIADTSADFVNKIQLLSRDARLRNLMILNAKKVVEKSFSYDALMKNRLNIINSINSESYDKWEGCAFVK